MGSEIGSFLVEQTRSCFQRRRRGREADRPRRAGGGFGDMGLVSGTAGGVISASTRQNPPVIWPSHLGGHTLSPDGLNTLLSPWEAPLEEWWGERTCQEEGRSLSLPGSPCCPPAVAVLLMTSCISLAVLFVSVR